MPVRRHKMVVSWHKTIVDCHKMTVSCHKTTVHSHTNIVDYHKSISDGQDVRLHEGVQIAAYNGVRGKHPEQFVLQKAE